MTIEHVINHKAREIFRKFLADKIYAKTRSAYGILPMDYVSIRYKDNYYDIGSIEMFRDICENITIDEWKSNEKDFLYYERNFAANATILDAVNARLTTLFNAVKNN